MHNAQKIGWGHLKMEAHRTLHTVWFMVMASQQGELQALIGSQDLKIERHGEPCIFTCRQTEQAIEHMHVSGTEAGRLYIHQH